MVILLLNNAFQGDPVGVDNAKKVILLLDNAFQGDPAGMDDVMKVIVQLNNAYIQQFSLIH